jgi:hypothetical protein
MNKKKQKKKVMMIIIEVKRNKKKRQQKEKFCFVCAQNGHSLSVGSVCNSREILSPEL